MCAIGSVSSAGASASTRETAISRTVASHSRTRRGSVPRWPMAVIHGALLTAVHQHPLEAVTVTELAVAAAVVDWAVVDNE